MSALTHTATEFSLIAVSMGSGMMAGLFAAFSSFVMRALKDIDDTAAIAAMQSINIKIVRPSFLLVFLGTAAAGLLLPFVAPHELGHAANWTLLAAGVYTLGCVGVTMVKNVPLNNRLAAVDAGSVEAKEVWALYLHKWLMWNHVRTLSTLASTALFLFALAHIG